MENIFLCSDSSEWDDYVLAHNGHPLQLWGWGEVKAGHGWRVERVFVKQNDEKVGAVQLLIKPLPKPFNSLVYIPRGPIVSDEKDRAVVLASVSAYAKNKHSAVAITAEPDWTNTEGLEGWSQSTNTILIPSTLILDLNRSEDDLLADMSKKTRQYIRKSGKESLEVRLVQGRDELAQCMAIYHQTAKRAGFAIHDDDYYYDVYDKLGDHSPVLVAIHEGRVVAFLWLAISQSVAFELYGGVNDIGQNLRVNYVLKWEAIRLMKKWGINRYDMNGLLNDGVSNFKRGFASHEDMLVGTFDKPLSPLYIVWDKGLPLAKKIIRKIKNR